MKNRSILVTLLSGGEMTLGKVTICKTIFPSFAECLQGGHSAKNFQKKIFLCRVPLGRALSKEFFFKKNISLPSASREDSRQTITKKNIYLPSASREGTRQRISKKNYFFAEYQGGRSAKNFQKTFISLPSASREGTR